MTVTRVPGCSTATAKLLESVLPFSQRCPEDGRRFQEQTLSLNKKTAKCILLATDGLAGGDAIKEMQSWVYVVAGMTNAVEEARIRGGSTEKGYGGFAWGVTWVCD